MFQKSLLLGLVSLMIQGPAFGATIYNLIDLGTLGGGFSRASAISEDGRYVTGTSELSDGSDRAFIWEAGPGMLNIGTAGSGESEGKDVNNNKNVVGQTGGQAFRWTEGGGLVLLDASNPGAANDLNESDQAIGSRTLTGSSRTLKWDAANTISNPFPFDNTIGIANNNSGEIVGTQSGVGFFNTGVNTTRTGLGSFIPTDINDARLISGSVASDAALLDFNTNNTTIIGKLTPMHTLARALTVSSDGLTAGGESIGPGGSLGFIYTSGEGIQDLTSMLSPSFSGWTVTSVVDIAGNGWFAVTANNPMGEQRAGIVVKVPEPAFGKIGSEFVAKMFDSTAKAIIETCKADDTCEVPANVSANVKYVTDAASVEQIANDIQAVIETGSLSGENEEVAREGLEVLRAAK